MTDQLLTYRVQVFQRGMLQGDGAPIRALDDAGAQEQARQTARHMGAGTTFKVFDPAGELLWEYSR